MSGKIFISYRRDDVKETTARIYDRLTSVVGPQAVFMDIDALQPGERFDRKLMEALSESDVFLAIIGPRWLDILVARAQRKEPDFVRAEIYAALTKGLIVVPVLVDSATLPDPNQLPEEIRDLVMHQTHEVKHERFGRDIDDLLKGIGANSKKSSAGRPPKSLWLGVGAVAIAATLATGWYSLNFLSGHQPTDAPSIGMQSPKAVDATPPPPTDRVDIIFSAPIPEQFSQSHATTCRFPAKFLNRSRYHIDKITLRIGDRNFSVGDMSANTQLSQNEAGRVKLTPSHMCADEAAYLQSHISEVTVFDCAMRGVAEGDCQQLIHVTSDFSEPDLLQIRQSEVEAGERNVAAAVAAEDALRKEAAAQIANWKRSITEVAQRTDDSKLWVALMRPSTLMVQDGSGKFVLDSKVTDSCPPVVKGNVVQTKRVPNQPNGYVSVETNNINHSHSWVKIDDLSFSRLGYGAVQLICTDPKYPHGYLQTSKGYGILPPNKPGGEIKIVHKGEKGFLMWDK